MPVWFAAFVLQVGRSFGAVVNLRLVNFEGNEGYLLSGLGFLLDKIRDWKREDGMILGLPKACCLVLWMCEYCR